MSPGANGLLVKMTLISLLVVILAKTILIDGMVTWIVEHVGFQTVIVKLLNWVSLGG